MQKELRNVPVMSTSINSPLSLEKSVPGALLSQLCNGMITVSPSSITRSPRTVLVMLLISSSRSCSLPLSSSSSSEGMTVFWQFTCVHPGLHVVPFFVWHPDLHTPF